MTDTKEKDGEQQPDVPTERVVSHVSPEVATVVTQVVGAVRELKEAQLKIADVKHKTSMEGFAFATREANADRKFQGESEKRRMIFTGVMVAMLGGFAIYLITAGMKDLVADLTKVLVGAGVMWLKHWSAERPKPPPVTVEQDDD